MTAETEDRLLVVDLRTGRVIRRIALPADPENVVASDRVAVVVSARAGSVTLIDRIRMRVLGVLRGFRSPHIPGLSADGSHAYVTDDARGTVTVIGLSERSILGSATAGPGAHHLAASPDGRRLWVALGESADTIAILDVSDPRHPRVVDRFHPGFAAHDLSFTPDGRRVWITSASGRDVTVFSARERRPLFTVPVGPGPQHIAFDGAYAYLTSGYGGTIEEVALASGRVLRRAGAPRGSFELDARDGYVVVSSLTRGRLPSTTPACTCCVSRTWLRPPETSRSRRRRTRPVRGPDGAADSPHSPLK